jgi:5-methylcytosine-specific restriction endonuclease McrA
MSADPKEFENVSIYTEDESWGNIVRIDAKQARIWVGPYAQYQTGVFVEFVPVGKRKNKSFVSAGDPYVVVVPSNVAVDPDDLYIQTNDLASPTRYTAADPRWREDFNKKLQLSAIPILADYRGIGVPATPPAQIAENAYRPSAVDAPEPVAPEAEDNLEDFQHDEGLRSSAERSFFERNPDLSRRAKEFYGCVCQVCGFDFVRVYGEIGQDYAEVHHLNPLSERSPEEWTEAVRTRISDVAVLCANCHRMIHRRRPALSLDELRTFMRIENK